MRKRLQPDNDSRKKFRAIFRRFGKKTNFHGYADQTILLVNVRDVEKGILITDHVWFAFTKGFEKVGLKPGATVEFDARIKSYTKGYVNRKFNIDNRSVDYKLSNPTKISIIPDPGRSGLADLPDHP